MRKPKVMATLDREQILDMASEFQWMPERGCIRLALARGSDDDVMLSLNNFAETMTTQDIHCRVSGNSIQLLLATLSYRAGAEKIDGSEIMTGAVELAEVLGVDQSLIGVVNFYTVTYALLVRYKFPKRWNHFCYCAEKPGWKVVLHTVNAAGLESTVELAESAELPENPVSLSGTAVKHCAEEVEDQPTGLGLAFGNAEFYAFSESIMKVGSGDMTMYNVNPDTDPDTGSGSPQDQAIRDRLFEALVEEAAKKKGSRGL